MDFLLFLLLNTILFIRPGEIVPALEGAPIYQIVILACLVVSGFKVLAKLNGPALLEQPITVCVLGMAAAVFLSQVMRFHPREAMEGGMEFGKIVLYYLLLVAVLDSWSRLRLFLQCLPLLIVVLTLIAVLQFHGAIDLPTIGVVSQNELDPETGEVAVLVRMRSTGIFNDPNDLALILVVGICLCLYWLGCRDQGVLRFLWAAPLLFFGYALMLTQSRGGGMLALVVALLVLFQARYGWWRTVALASVVLPVLLLLFAGRQTRFDLSGGDTGQSRLQLWSEGLSRWRESPLFGIGYDQFVEEVGWVAHNSYVQCFTELGLFGGTIFVGMGYAAFLALLRLRSGVAPGEPARFRPFLIALLAGYCAGMLSLSRSYVLPTYLVFGLVTAYTQAAPAFAVAAPVRFNGRFLGRMALASAASLAGIYLFTRLFVQYGS